MRTNVETPAVTTENLGFLLAKASQRFNERLVQGFAEHEFPGVRASYGSVLVPLFEQDGLRVGTIGAHARLSKQAMTRLVRECEADGLVRRARDEDDGRACRIELTERGRELRAVAEQVLGQLDEEILARLGPDRRAALAEALKGVIQL